MANATKATLYDMEGKAYVPFELRSSPMKMSTSACHRIAVGKAEWPLYEGRTFCVSTKEIELERSLTKSEYLSGQCFGGSNIMTCPESAPNSEVRLSRQFVPLKMICPPSLNLSVPESKHSVPIQFITPSSTAQECSSKSDDASLESGASHWTVNWYATMSLHSSRFGVQYIIGENNRPKNTRLGMVTLMSPAMVKS